MNRAEAMQTARDLFRKWQTSNLHEIAQVEQLADALMEANGQTWPFERTPETVLRAMLKAYEAAALNLNIAYFRAADGSDEDEALCVAADMAGGALSDLRDATAAAIVGGNPEPILKMWGFWADYEARLSGARPLNAPPMEAT